MNHLEHGYTPQFRHKNRFVSGYFTQHSRTRICCGLFFFHSFSFLRRFRVWWLWVTLLSQKRLFEEEYGEKKNAINYIMKSK